MELEQLHGVLQMLARIQALSHDPDAAELVLHGAQLASTLEPLAGFHEAAQHGSTSQHSEFTDGSQLNLVEALLLPLLQHTTSQPCRQRCLSEATLRRLSETVLSASHIERMKANEGDAVCAICQEDYLVGKRVVELPCQHLFCIDCGRNWLRRNYTCPICRSEVTEEEIERTRGGGQGWHAEDLFPMRYAHGSPLAAVRRAREARQTGMLELWPPVQDMERVAEGHSMWRGSQPDVASPSDPVQELMGAQRHARSSPFSSRHGSNPDATQSVTQESIDSIPPVSTLAPLPNANGAIQTIERREFPTSASGASSPVPRRTQGGRSSLLQSLQQNTVVARQPSHSVGAVRRGNHANQNRLPSSSPGITRTTASTMGVSSLRATGGTMRPTGMRPVGSRTS